MKVKLKKLLKDQDFISLINEQTSEYFNVFDVLGTAEYEIRHSNVLAWLINSKGSHGLANYFMENLWDYISKDHKLDSVQFNDYTVSREGENEKEKAVDRLHSQRVIASSGVCQFLERPFTRVF